jgi:hypothetical protein
MYEQLFFRALCITISVETLILYLLVEKFVKVKPGKKLILFTGFISSFATLPYVWYLFPKYISDYTVFILTSESSVILIEAFIYQYILQIGFRRCLIFSLVCNTISTIIGLLINNFLNF